jgi:hypothetical protein
MVDVFTKKRVILQHIFLVLLLIEVIASVQGVLVVYFYDRTTGLYTGLFGKAWVRFALRELLIYINVSIGFISLRRLYPTQGIAFLFVVTTVFLDLIFTATGLFRYFGWDFLAAVDAYFTIFKFIGSGLVYLFYGMLGLIGVLKQLEE